MTSSSEDIVPSPNTPKTLSSCIYDACEIDEGRLYFTSLYDGFEARNDGQRVFCDTNFTYQHFFADFGPLHLGHVHAFCRKLAHLLKNQEHLGTPVYVWSSHHPHRRSNAAVLVITFAVLCFGRTAEEAYAPFAGIHPPLMPFRDASFGICTYQLEVLDCARAMARAAALGHVDMNTFDAEQYMFLDKIEHGDLNWIIPGKFLAFSGPLSQRREVEPGKRTLLAEDYVPIFRKLGVTCVIRFNKKCYDRRRFTERGIKHHDLFYEDGSNPTEDIWQRFLQICEKTQGAIAVHCKAGLGRTGTNIALYMMKHYGYSAAESIALCRICRPGSIVGPQQHFLHELELRMKKEGDRYRQGILRQSDTDIRESTGQVIPSAVVTSRTGCGAHCGGAERAAQGSYTRRPTTSPHSLRRHYSTSGGGFRTGEGPIPSEVMTTRRHFDDRWISEEGRGGTRSGQDRRRDSDGAFGPVGYTSTRGLWHLRRRRASTSGPRRDCLIKEDQPSSVFAPRRRGVTGVDIEVDANNDDIPSQKSHVKDRASCPGQLIPLTSARSPGSGMPLDTTRTWFGGADNDDNLSSSGPGRRASTVAVNCNMSLRSRSSVKRQGVPRQSHPPIGNPRGRREGDGEPTAWKAHTKGDRQEASATRHRHI